MGQKPRRYDLNIDLNVLNHLGLNLYSNVPAVLSELVANAWDADANQVSICIKEMQDGKQIVVCDDGCGMDDTDLREKFLTVGYQRRTKQSEDLTPGGRVVMGRKGIGKLSILSIAEKVQIITKREGCESLAIELDVKEIRKAIKYKRVYHPPRIEVPRSTDTDIENHGTVLILSNLMKRVNASLDPNLRKRIARRFSIVSEDFQVIIDGEKITLDDRGYFEKLEYALVYGDYDKSGFKHDEEYFIPRKNVVNKEIGHSVRGWIGLAKESGMLQEDTDNLNKIAVLARGKVALEDILETFREGGMYTKYVIGELEADFLDLTKEEDIATSSRQDFIRSDERFGQLRDFVEKELRFLQNERAQLKNIKGTEAALEIPAVKEWYNTLGSDSRREAEKLFGRINRIATDGEHRKTLYKHGVLAFEHLRHKEKLNELEQLDINNLETAVKLFSELDDIEASWYYQITEGRLDVIRKLKEHVSENALEKVIQNHIYNHLWLLDPSWDRATDPVKEQSVIKEFEKISDKLTEEEKKGRLDIRYKRPSGKHVIIELKRASVSISDADLMKQVDKYIQSLRKQLQEQGEGGSIEAICLVGKGLKEWSDPQRQDVSERALEVKGIRVITYRQLIDNAEESYKEYIAKAEDKGRIKRLLDAIDKS